MYAYPITQQYFYERCTCNIIRNNEGLKLLSISIPVAIVHFHSFNIDPERGKLEFKQLFFSDPQLNNFILVSPSIAATYNVQQVHVLASDMYVQVGCQLVSETNT